jgi:hypothetical protein
LAAPVPHDLRALGAGGTMTAVSGPVSDQQLETVLGRFAAVADVVLRNPGAWLGHDETGAAAAERSRGLRRLGGRLEHDAARVRRLLTGRVHPGSPGWDELPLRERCDWWVSHVRAVAAPLAATPRVLGALADRLPVQGALGSAAAGLVVCAVAKESGIESPQDWVPLLGAVLFDRDLARPAAVPTPEEAEAAAAEELPAGVPAAPLTPRGHVGPVRRAARGLWRLARLLWGLADVFDERPRGAWVWRTLGRVPVVGLPAGFLDERGAVRAAADETLRLVRDAGAGAGTARA